MMSRNLPKDTGSVNDASTKPTELEPRAAHRPTRDPPPSVSSRALVLVTGAALLAAAPPTVLLLWLARPKAPRLWMALARQEVISIGTLADIATYVSVFIGIASLATVPIILVAMYLQIRNDAKSRELAVLLPILHAYVDDSRLSRLRRFVHRHWDEVSSHASAAHGGVDDVETRWARAIQRASNDATPDDGDKVTKEDIDVLVNSLNHICILLESHQLESLDIAFSDPIVGMWNKLGQFVLDERERRRKDRDSHASFFGIHFENRAKAFQSEECLRKLKAEAEKRGVTWVEKP